MAATTASPLLNAEPSLPETREKAQLPPKSYADALEDEPEQVETSQYVPVNGTGEDETKGVDVNVVNGKMNGVEERTGPRAAVVRILPTGTNGETKEKESTNGKELKKGEIEAGGDAVTEKHTTGEQELALPEKSDDATTEESKGGRPATVERQESKHEYEAAGLDESPRSPPRYKHRKAPSRGSNNSKRPSTPESLTKSDDAVFETFQDNSKGVKLVSVKKSNGNYSENLAQSRKEAPAAKKEDSNEDSKRLVSGRQAGKRWEQTPIRWAPLNVPLQRRLQTLVVLFHSTCIALSVSLFFFLCAIPIFWPLLIPYLIWLMSSNAGTSGTLRYRSNFLRGLPVWSLFASYFPARLHRTAELAPTRKYIFGYHPHGIISHGAFAAFCTEAMGFSQLFPGITNTLLTLDSNFRIPIYRDYALAMGLASVSRESCENLLSKGGANGEGMGRAITIVVGGARESLDAEPYSLRLVLKRRKGFVKMALRTGADLVPVLAFGENDLYDQVTSHSHPRIHKFQLMIKKLLGFTVPLFHARGVFNYDVGLMPYRRPLNIVVGRPLKVTQSVKPSQEQIDQLHEQYVVELERIWDTWKDDFAKDRREELQILE